MSPQSTANLTSYGNFDLVKRFRVELADVEISKWRSRDTGLSVVHVDYEAPIVDGYFALATEIFNDSGCPHTLEHLVFMGSEKYPYKGIIDHFANRGFSNGTNAWTDTDNTVYTVSTAGGQGFLQILPIYIDHILYPKITHSAFLTEVHHINGNGHDSGVVYSEMQGRENTSGDLMGLEFQRLMNPPGSAYRSETGGLMEALRKLTVDQIREYHATYYVPHNLSLIVTGRLVGGTASLLQVIQDQVEPDLIAHGQNKGSRPPGWKRPFLETASAIRPPIERSIESTVKFPEQDESHGELIIGFTGPAPDQHLELRALDVLGTYLTSSSIAPLNKEYVEIDRPLCSYIYFGEDDRATRVDLPIYVGSIPIEHIYSFDQKLKASLSRIAEDGVDMERMTQVINRDLRQIRSKLESSKGDTLSEPIISDFLFGPEDGSWLHLGSDIISWYDELRTWTKEQWSDLIRRYYLNASSVVIRGIPSAELAEKIKEDEKQRLDAQIEKLGPTGLSQAAEKLQTAQAEHDTPIPPSVLKQFPVPDVNSIAWIKVQSHQEGVLPSAAATQSSLREYIESDRENLPFFVGFNHVKSDFVSVDAFFSLSSLPNRLRPLVSVYASSFFSLPVQRASGELLSHEKVVKQLDEDTVSYDTRFGILNGFPELFRIYIEAETQMYETTVKWLKDLVYGSKFDIDRISVTLAKLQQSIPEMKRDGNTVLYSTMGEVLYSEKSTSRALGVTEMMDSIPKLIKQLSDDPQSVVADLETIRQHIANSGEVRFSVSGNVLALSKPRSIWDEIFRQKIPSQKLSPVPMTHDTLNTLGRNPSRKAVVVNLPIIESSFASFIAKGPQGFNHSDLAAFKIAREILNATEGFLWRYIRGSGLAYGASVGTDEEAGLLHFSLYRSSNAMQAYREAAKVVKGLVDGSIPLEDTDLDAAKSTIVFSVTKGVSTPTRAAMASFCNQALRGVSQDHSIELLRKFQAVTKEDVLRVLKTGYMPLFDPKHSIAVVVAAPSQVEPVATGLSELGYDVQHRNVEISPDDLSEMDVDGSDSSADEESSSDESTESSEGR